MIYDVTHFHSLAESDISINKDVSVCDLKVDEMYKIRSCDLGAKFYIHQCEYLSKKSFRLTKWESEKKS